MLHFQCVGYPSLTYLANLYPLLHFRNSFRRQPGSSSQFGNGPSFIKAELLNVVGPLQPPRPFQTFPVVSGKFHNIPHITLSD